MYLDFFFEGGGSVKIYVWIILQFFQSGFIGDERRVDANKKALARSSGAVSKVPFNTVIACNVLSQKLKQVGIKRIFSLFLRWLSPR